MNYIKPHMIESFSSHELVEVEGLEYWRGIQERPVILLAPHFVGLDMGGIRLAADYRLNSIYSRQKSAAADAIARANAASAAARAAPGRSAEASIDRGPGTGNRLPLCLRTSRLPSGAGCVENLTGRSTSPGRASNTMNHALRWCSKRSPRPARPSVRRPAPAAMAPNASSGAVARA